MIGLDVVVAGSVLALAVVAGLVAHEWSHALLLRVAGVEYTIAYFPRRSGGVIGFLAACPWAVVRPLPTGAESPWVFRVAALAPFLLAVPVVPLGLGGYLTGAQPALTAAAIGWLACAIPSPQDFSVVFHAHRLLDRESTAADHLHPAD